MKKNSTDIMVVLASTMVIQSALVGYLGYKAGVFDAHAKEATLSELRREKLDVRQVRYLFDFGDDVKQKEEDDMYVIQAPEKSEPLLRVKNQTDAPRGLFDYTIKVSLKPQAPPEPLPKTDTATQEAKAIPEAPIQIAAADKDKNSCEKRFIIHHFKRGSSKMNQMVKDQLNELVPQIKDASEIVVEGFTCPLGGQHINDVLAIKRAKNVAKYLKAKGVEVSEVKGKGKDKYISGDKELNRRVEIQTK